MAYSNESPLEIHSNASLALRADLHTDIHLLDTYALQGHRSQCHGEYFDDERQIVLGLDFGRSSVKVVIGDSALGRAFAVPFTQGTGIERYLLPCCLHEGKNVFSLVGSCIYFRDLKLSLLADPTDRVRQDRVVAFFALVIRHVRGWLFLEHGDIYRNTILVWKLVIGLPIVHHLESRFSSVFKNIGQIAWLVAGKDGYIDNQTIKSARTRARALSISPEHITQSEDVEVDVVPEIAAQIYGFVKSHQFDKNSTNIFLMVDVGAGTVDSSLFQVKHASGGRLDFEFFTSVVEPHGVMNLHRHRIEWWRNVLGTCPNSLACNLASLLDEQMFPTDRLVSLPNSYLQYF